MKRFFLLLFLLNALTCFSQNRYTIYSITGDVQYKSGDGVEWIRAKKKMPLHLGDFLWISQNGKVSILDNNTYYVYYSLQGGTFKVRSIIANAIQNESAQMKRLGKVLTINTTDEVERIKFRTIGGVKMGSASLEDSIASLLYSYLYYGVNNSQVRVNNQLCFRKVHISRDCFAFEITNNSPMGYFYNVARIDREKKRIYICYNISEIIDDEAFELSLFISSDDTVSFNDFPFATSKKEEYILFAVDKEFSVEVLQTILDKGYDEGNINSPSESINFCVGTNTDLTK